MTLTSKSILIEKTQRETDRFILNKKREVTGIKRNVGRI